MTFTVKEEKRMWGVLQEEVCRLHTKGCGLTSLWFEESEQFWNDKEAWLDWIKRRGWTG